MDLYPMMPWEEGLCPIASWNRFPMHHWIRTTPPCDQDRKLETLPSLVLRARSVKLRCLILTWGICSHYLRKTELSTVKYCVRCCLVFLCRCVFISRKLHIFIRKERCMYGTFAFFSRFSSFFTHGTF